MPLLVATHTWLAAFSFASINLTKNAHSEAISDVGSYHPLHFIDSHE
jgi:hypothetical protein